MHVFCTICGVLISPTSAGIGPVIPNEELKWYQELRTLRRQSADKAVYLTGIGYLNSSEVIIVPQNPAHSYRSSSTSLQSYTALYDHETHSWTFAFHAECWEILRERTSCGFSRTNCLATLFFNFLYCTTWNTRSCLEPGHDFGGAAKFQKPSRNPFRDMINEGCTYFTVKPSKFDSVNDVRDCLGPLAQVVRDPNTVVSSRKMSAFDPFSKLPIEVVHLLLTWLPSHDIQHLRLSSRSIAYRSHPGLLSQFFWRSRFSLDFEMGFVRPTHIDGYHDWRALYFSVKHELQLPQGSARLHNRKRIWNIIDFNAPLFDLHLSGIQLQGIPASWDNFFRVDDQESSPEAPKQGRVITTELIIDDSKILHVGSREISVRCLPHPLCKQYVRAIGISTVLFNSRVFVSAIRLLTENRIDNGHVSHPLGYVIPSTESFVWIKPQESFIGLELATRPNGISAVRAVSMGSSGKSYSMWIGNVESSEANIAFGMLCMDNEITSFKLVGSFDAFKMTALAIVDSSAAYSTLEVSENITPRRFIQQPLWTPNYPKKQPFVKIPEALQYQTYNPILNIDFGGTSGEKLSKLMRIVAHMGDKTAPFVGLMFDINGEDCIMYGKRGRTEVSFVIDGAGGERISKVMYEQASTSLGIWSLDIHTNFGRTVTFMPDKLQLERPGEVDLRFTPVPVEIQKKREITYSKRTLEPPNGQIITGFTSILGASNGVFQTFGLQCNYTPNQLITNDQNTATDGAISPANLCSSVGSYIIGGNRSGCKAYTYASMEHVRRIRFSCGSMSRPRRADEISGLWLDYVNSRSSEIVGQWISEIDSMNIEPDEQVIEVSIWISKTGFSSNEKYYLGRVVRISVLTSHMQSKTIQASQSVSISDCTVLKFRANKFEYLASFVWAFNADFDHPRILSSLVTKSEHILLWDVSGDLSIYQWMVPEKVFWKETNLNGQLDQVIAIAAYQACIYGSKYITGLKFTYKSGATNTIGRICGESCTEASFGDDERIVILEVFSGRYGILDITLHSECLEGEHSRRSQALIGRTIEIPESWPTVYHDQIDFSSHQLRMFTLDKRGSQEVEGPLKIPEKEMVGLWGFNMNEGRLTLGVIFLEMGGENESTDGSIFKMATSD